MLARTSARISRPASAATSVYCELVALPILTQFRPTVSQIRVSEVFEDFSAERADSLKPPRIAASRR